MFDDLKISELQNLLVTPSAGDLLPIVNNGETKNSTFANLSKRNFITTSVNRIITIEDQIILANAAAGNILLTLPTPSIAIRGLIYYFKKTDSSSNSVTVSGGTYLIDSATTFVLNAQNQTLGIFCDGAKFQILNKIVVQNIFDYIIFNTSYSPTGNEPEGSLYWNSTLGSLESVLTGGNVNVAIGEQLYARVRNVEATALNPGEVVYLFGASGNKATVKRASNAGDSTSSKTLGLVAETIAPNQIGYVITQGVIEKMNVGSPFEAGDVLWLGSTPGTFTRIKPTQPNHLVFIGIVERANNGNGQIYVKPQNGYELNEIHDVLITNPINNQALVWESSTLLWKNKAILATTFETINKNLSAYPAQINYNQSGDLSTIVFTIPSGTITKTFNYTGADLTSIVLSGSTPSGINLTKSFAYTNGNLTGVSYS
jgi:hypothetical protein